MSENSIHESEERLNPQVRMKLLESLIQKELNNPEVDAKTKLVNSKIFLDELAELIAKTVLAGILLDPVEPLFYKAQEILKVLEKTGNELLPYLEQITKEKFTEQELYSLGNEHKMVLLMLEFIVQLGDRVINYTPPEEPTN